MATVSKVKTKANAHANARARRAHARKTIPTSQFADAFTKFVDQMNEQAPVPESVFQKAFEKHFKTKKLDGLPVLDENFTPADHPNLHLAIEAYMNAEGRSYTLDDYMQRQRDLAPKMRAILVDWMVDVHIKFKLLSETMFLAVNIIEC